MVLNMSICTSVESIPELGAAERQRYYFGMGCYVNGVQHEDRGRVSPAGIMDTYRAKAMQG